MAESSASPALLDECESVAPTNPFFAAAYARARRIVGEEPLLFYVERDGARTEHCPGFLRSGRMTQSLEIPSAFSFSTEFVVGLQDFCRSRRVSSLIVNTFASSAGRIPELPGEVGRIARREFVMDLKDRDLMRSLSKTHRQRVRQGEKAGLVFHHTSDPRACEAHLRLMGASMDRRRDRGENTAHVQDDGGVAALLEHGAAELFQALLDGVPVSSMSVLRSRLGGYDQSSGTSPEGMAAGASHFLIFNTASHLQREGAEVFNLGGAREAETGLAGFKTHFGTRTVDLELIECQPAGFVHGMIVRAAAAIRRR